MEQTDALKRIDMPNENKENRYVNYENKLKPMLDFENEELKSLYFQHEPQLLAMAEKEAWDYLVRFGAWDFEPGESFPCGKVLTGEWYIGTISLEDDEQIYGSIEMRFTAYYQSPTARMPVDDYLGMDCFFYYDSEIGTFIFDCFNTSAI